MCSISEIYLANSFIPKNEWARLIDVISRNNGFLSGWSIIITDEDNQIRYFIKTKHILPITINNLKSFIFAPISKIKLQEPNSNFAHLSSLKSSSNIIDLINYCEIKNKGILKYLEIDFLKLNKNKIISKTNFYLKNNNNVIKKYNAFLAIPVNILSVDFQSNRRYFYKKCPSYLYINKTLQSLNTSPTNALLLANTFPYSKKSFYLNLDNFNFDKHSVIIGSSGCGKSKFASLLIKNLSENFRQNYKVVLIDPHASLENDIGGIGKVIDFSSRSEAIDLFLNESDAITSTELNIDLLKSLIADQYNSKLERVLRHSIFLLLAAKSFNFENLRKTILDLEYRNYLIEQHKETLPISTIEFFLNDFNELKSKSYNEAISPVISFIDEMEMIPIFNSKPSAVNLEDTIKNNFLTLFSIDKTRFGNKITKTIAGLIMQQLFGIIQKRRIKEHIILIIDEVSIIENPILSKYLSESRKFNLSLILIGQYFDQISESLKKAIFANVANYFIFRVSRLDASLLVDSFNMKLLPDDSKEAKIKLLTSLNDRECIARIYSYKTLLPAFKGTTLDFESIPKIKEFITSMKCHSHDMANLGRPKTNFSLQSNIKLEDILMSNSTSGEREQI